MLTRVELAAETGRVLGADALVDGCMKAREIASVRSLASRVGATVCFEFGTFSGIATANIADAVGPGGKVYTLDVLPHQMPPESVAPEDARYIAKPVVGSFLAQHASLRARVVQLLGDSRTLDYASLRLDGLCDFVLVDGGHHLDTVASDTTNALRLCRRGGIIAWHDYRGGCFPGVDRVVEAIEVLIGRVYHIEGTTLAYAQTRP